MKWMVVSPIMCMGLLIGSAHAQGWSDFSGAFPAFPCHDGWMGCMVGETRVDPGLKGSPADFRISWFELTPTPAFSPFVGLSQYANGAGDGVAVMDAPDPAEAERVQAAAQAAQVDEAAATQATADAVEKEAAAQQRAREAETRRAQAEAEEQRRRDEEKRRRAEADRLSQQQAASQDAAEQQRLAREAERARQQAAEAEQQRLAAQQEAQRQRDEEERLRQQAQQEEQRRKDAEIAQAAAEQRRRDADEERERQAAALAAARVATPVPQPVVADDSCDELTRLEPAAMLGRLSAGQIACLEGRIAADPKMTDKEKSSLVLMANAWSSGDRTTWENLVKRHLDDIDQSDPDLCYKYALYLSNAGSSRASGVIRWVEVALANRTVWTADTYTSRVNSLNRLRAKASQDLWKKAEEDHASSPTDETRAKVDKYRNMTKVNAREWYEYARSAGKDQTVALQLCMSAAGTKDYCEAS